MSPTLIKSFYRAPAAIAALLVMLASPMLARGEAIPRPEGIQQDVNFWIRVYTEVNTNEGFLHDERNLGVDLRHLEVQRRQLIARPTAHGR